MWEPPAVLLAFLHESAAEKERVAKYLKELWTGMKKLMCNVDTDVRAQKFVRDLKWPQSQYCLEWFLALEAKDWSPSEAMLADLKAF
eukprot:5936046-Amphidinium_carterae.1